MLSNILLTCSSTSSYSLPRPQSAAPDVAGNPELEVLLAADLGEAALEADLEADQGDGVAHPETGVGARSAVQQAVRKQHKVTGVGAFPGNFLQFSLLDKFPSRLDHLDKCDQMTFPASVTQRHT